MSQMRLTFFFEDIFQNYEEWKDYFKDLNIVNYDKAEEALFDQYCFNILARHFSHQNIRYEEPESFLLEIVNVYQNKFLQFKRQKETIDKIYNLTDSDLTELEAYLTNLANNPNDNVSDPKQVLNYIQTQTYQTRSGNKLDKYLQALNNIPTLNTYNFLKADNKEEMGFKDLFMQVQPNQYYIYDKGEY